MAAVTKKRARLQLRVVANTDHSIHAGRVAVESRARRFDLWNKLRRIACSDLRKDRHRGHDAEALVGQFLFVLCSMAGCLSDGEALNNDPLTRELFGVRRIAGALGVGTPPGPAAHPTTARVRDRARQCGLGPPRKGG